MAPPSLSRSTAWMIRAALSCRCPRCGTGRIYDGFLTLGDRCEECGLPLAAADGGDGPAVFIIFILSFALIPPAIIVALRVDWPLWLHALIWGIVIVGASVGALRPAKALTLALQYHYKPETFSEPRNEG